MRIAVWKIQTNPSMLIAGWARLTLGNIETVFSNSGMSLGGVERKWRETS
jgi:hypothetical protein